MTLVIHGTNEIPAHMKNGPRNYNHDYNNSDKTFYYKENGNKADYNSLEPSGDNEYSDVSAFKNAYPGILGEVQDQLLRIHHRNPFLSDV